MSENEKFDFKKHWLQLTPDERNAFADEAGNYQPLHPDAFDRSPENAR